MITSSQSNRWTFYRTRLSLWADVLAAALAASLPWSTSATGILVVIWLIVLLPTLTISDIQREVMTFAGAFPVLLWAMGVIGMVWADVSLAERLAGLSSFHKLLIIPLLLAQFRRSPNVSWVLNSFLAACVALLIVSFLFYVFPISLRSHGGLLSPKERAVPVKDYISQSGMFVLCAAGLALVTIDSWRTARRFRAVAWALLASAFLANIAFIATGRTALAVLPLLLILLGMWCFGWKGSAWGIGIAGLVVAILLVASPFLRERTIGLFQEVRVDRLDSTMSSAGQRLEFWRKSWDFVRQAPVFGHGTGTIRSLFAAAAAGQSGAAGLASANPHQQTLAVAIQLGLVGTVLLWAMWLSHLCLFRKGSMLAWFGLIVVVQNMIGSMFNSHLFDFTQGWTYVVGVGVCGGGALRAWSAARGPAGPA